MRDPEKYLAEGRNDPHSPEQRLEHPYDFVSLPDKPAKGDVVLHHTIPADRWSGTLRLVYRLETPLHIGSGVFENAKDLGLSARDQPVRGILRSGDRPVLPGSSWKGVVRSRFEAITHSRFALDPKTRAEGVEKVPETLRRGTGKHHFELRDPKVRELAAQRIVRKPADLETASPADTLVGCMGYRARVLPGEGKIEGEAANRTLDVPALESPQPHRLAKPGAMRHERDARYAMTQVEGRKFYYDGEVRRRDDARSQLPGQSARDRDREPSWEPIDYVPEGATITLDVAVRSLSEAEIGGLLVAAGHGDAVGIVRFGGYKSAGLGKATLVETTAALQKGSGVRAWRRQDPEAFDLGRAVAEGHRRLIDTKLLAELHQITTMRRPSA